MSERNPRGFIFDTNSLDTPIDLSDGHVQRAYTALFNGAAEGRTYYSVVKDSVHMMSPLSYDTVHLLSQAVQRDLTELNRLTETGYSIDY